MRGEYPLAGVGNDLLTELPPRARRILPAEAIWCVAARTTSACAENTSPRLRRICTNWNYLRVRGEYGHRNKLFSINGELPPRARRIPTQSWRVDNDCGTTSACAENTGLTLTRFSPLRNYLRVRGEYLWKPYPRFRQKELPPRARRIRPARYAASKEYGTTSACAENTVGSGIVCL